MQRCDCQRQHRARRIVLTGGPGAGKTAVLELMRQAACPHVKVLPESAGIVFGGGFPRGPAIPRRQAAQRAIYYVQRELEAQAEAENPALILCDRGTIDGAAFWPGDDPAGFWESVGSSLERELARYHAVIHLRTPPVGSGFYNHSNPLRVETEMEAGVIDRRIADLWRNHPRRFEVPAMPDFLEKAGQALALLRGEVPECCRGQVLPLPGVVTPYDREAALLAG